MPNEKRPETKRRPGLVGELWSFMRVRKKFWLAPIMISLLLLGLLMFLATGAGPLSPFVYMF